MENEAIKLEDETQKKIKLITETKLKLIQKTMSVKGNYHFFKLIIKLKLIFIFSFLYYYNYLF